MHKNYLVENLEFIKYVPGFIFIKDFNLEYAGMSDSFAEFLGWRCSEHALGKTDYQVPCKISEYADRFRADDSMVINKNTRILNLEIYNFAAGWKSVIVEKKPFKSSAKGPIVSFCQVFDVSNISIFKGCQNLNYNDKKIVGVLDRPATYILNSERCPLPLPPRQQECVFLLVRGKTFKEIAYLLRLSERTVEDYIECIKHKLGCHTKGQVIEKAIDSGFLFYIPERFLGGDRDVRDV